MNDERKRPTHVSKKKLKKLGGKVYSRPDKIINNNIVVKEWQRLPRQLIHEYTQRQKRPKPRFYQVRCRKKCGHHIRIVLPDPKKESKNVSLCPAQCFTDRKLAEEYAALLALHHFTPSLPLDRKLPQPFANVWRNMGNNKNVVELSNTNDDDDDDEKMIVTATSRFVSSSEREQEEIRRRKHRAQQKSRKLQHEMREKQKNVVVNMSEKNRQFIEDIVKTYDNDTNTYHICRIETSLQRKQLQEVSNYLMETEKFNDSDSQKASEFVLTHIPYQYYKDGRDLRSIHELKTDALDWCVLHTPEYRLPTHYDPRGKQLEVILNNNNHNSNDDDNDGRLIEYACKLGFPRYYVEDVVRTKLDKKNKFILFKYLYGELYEFILDYEQLQQQREEEEDNNDDDESNEIESLQAILVDDAFNVKRDYPSKGEYMLTIQSSKIGRLDLYYTTSTMMKIPFYIVHTTTLSSVQRLILVQQLVLKSNEFIMNGYASFIYDIITWYESNYDDLLKKDLIELPQWRRKITKKQHAPPNHNNKTKHHYNRRHENELKNDEHLNERMYNELCAEENTVEYKEMLKQRESLPVYKRKDEIIRLLNENNVVVICGATGSGKSTQIPQMILENCIRQRMGSTCNIICTQPRRISAVGLAERVSNERCEKVGHSVGYRIRLENRVSKYTKLSFVTTGILLRMMSNDAQLKGVSHVIVDEVHERSTDIDFLLLILHQLMIAQKKRNETRLKIVLMSATLNADIFSCYFDQCPIINISGRTFPVKEIFVEDIMNTIQYTPQGRMRRRDGKDVEQDAEELMRMSKHCDEYVCNEVAHMNLNVIDYDLLVKIVQHIINTSKNGGILIFLPGLQDINIACARLQSCVGVNNNNTWLIPLHSSISTLNQQRIFLTTPKGIRKIVVSTNIAETSITVNDIVYVIESGRMKQLEYEPNIAMTSLVETWVSHANATQRRGRAGRVRAGYCYYLYSKLQYSRLCAFQPPEIQRTSLEYICLQIKLLGLDMKKHKSIKLRRILSLCIEPPSNDAIDSALRTLKQIKALTSNDNEILTPLGNYLARLPCASVKIGKMLIYSALLQCVTPICCIASLITERTPFISNVDNRDVANAAKSEFIIERSDHLTAYNAYDKWLRIKSTSGRQTAIDFCKQSFLSWKTFESVEGMCKQFIDGLKSIGLITNHDGVNYDKNAENYRVIDAIICAGLYPNIVRVQATTSLEKTQDGTFNVPTSDPKMIKYYTKDSRVFIHPSSVNFTQNHYYSPWLVYLKLMKTSRVFIYDSTMVTPYALLLFAGDELHVDMKNQLICIDKWIKFRASPRICILIRGLQRHLNTLLHEKINTPTLNISSSSIIHGIITLLSSQGF